jgi:glycerophosphoryl diester phosphodiesterase
MDPIYIALIVILSALVVGVCLWLFLIGAVHTRRMDEYKSIKYAHRGLHGALGGKTYAAENSLTAFARATERGFGIELDVRVTKDGELVVFHDDTLDRVCGVSGRVIDKTLAELRQTRLSETEDTIPTFGEVLELVHGRVPLLVEIKEDGFDHTAAVLAARMLGEYDGPYIVESFNPLSLSAVKKENPQILRGFLWDKLTSDKSRRALKYRIIQRQLLNFLARPHFIAASHKSYKKSPLFPLLLVKVLFKPSFIAWTIRSPEEEKAAYEMGFDGIIFENYIPDDN